MIGEILVRVAFGACLISVVSYFLHHLRGTPLLLKTGRWFYFATVACIVGTAAFLLSLILTHRFDYTYVWSYSSRSLPTPLLISTFYAGQEGSFMLWALFTSIIGLFLVRYTSRMGYEAQVMSIFGLIDLMLIVMLIAKNPFLRVWESWPGEVQAGFTPADGRGLNPLLQNYWMVIHPQVLFSGFAAMGAPYAFAVAALMKRDYTQWIKPATPWMVFAALVLGTGIMMGGFWAYETLGWGGYWGWDPVENSSLVPWLFSIAGIHTILSQRKTGGFLRTNLILGMFGFLMVLYSTFLTRSGVLGDTSVHSFVDAGMWVYWLLIGVILVFMGIGFTMLAIRWKDIPRPKIQASYYSREFALFLGAIALVATALFITAGTSSPIITGILYDKKSAIEPGFYTTTVMPIGIIIGFLAGVGQLLWWTRSDRGALVKALRMPVLISLLATIVLASVGVRDLRGILFVFGAAFALSANIQVGLRVFRGNPKFMGGAVAHVGLGLMFFGFIASSQYDSKQTVSLTQGTPVDAMGYRLTYVGYQPVEKDKYAFQVDVEKDGRRYRVAPIMYYSSYNDGLMRNPDILNLVSHDFYLAPLSLEQPGADKEASIEKASFGVGQTRKIGDLTITFLGYRMQENAMAAMAEGKEVRIGARLSVSRDGSAAKLVEPAKLVNKGQMSDVADRYEDRFEFTVTGMSPGREAREKSTVEIGVHDALKSVASPATPDILVAETSVKPFINLVWAGLIIVLVGFLITIVRRTQEANLKHSLVTESE
jgi:cytochrome c-type biogenesis protein CcmF